MTANDFRKLALSLADAIESAHMDHPDFRVGGKIFATLGYPDASWAVGWLPATRYLVILDWELICVEQISGFRVLGSRLASGFRVCSKFPVHRFRFQVPGRRSPCSNPACDEPRARNPGTRHR